MNQLLCSSIWCSSIVFTVGLVFVNSLSISNRTFEQSLPAISTKKTSDTTARTTKSTSKIVQNKTQSFSKLNLEMTVNSTTTPVQHTSINQQKKDNSEADLMKTVLPVNTIDTNDTIPANLSMEITKTKKIQNRNTLTLIKKESNITTNTTSTTLLSSVSKRRHNTSMIPVFSIQKITSSVSTLTANINKSLTVSFNDTSGKMISSVAIDADKINTPLPTSKSKRNSTLAPFNKTMTPKELPSTNISKHSSTPPLLITIQKLGEVNTKENEMPTSEPHHIKINEAHTEVREEHPSQKLRTHYSSSNITSEYEINSGITKPTKMTMIMPMRRRVPYQLHVWLIVTIVAAIIALLIIINIVLCIWNKKGMFYVLQDKLVHGYGRMKNESTQNLSEPICYSSLGN